MQFDEIEVPKELRHFMMDGVKETILGKKNGANKQYRYGNLHIREYDNKYLVHMDKVDPRKDPLGHLIHDAPEILVGIACGAIGFHKFASNLLYNKSKKPSLIDGIITPLFWGYLGYHVTKKIKNYKGD